MADIPKVGEWAKYTRMLLDLPADAQQPVWYPSLLDIVMLSRPVNINYTVSFTGNGWWASTPLSEGSYLLTQMQARPAGGGNIRALGVYFQVGAATYPTILFDGASAGGGESALQQAVILPRPILIVKGDKLAFYLGTFSAPDQVQLEALVYPVTDLVE